MQSLSDSTGRFRVCGVPVGRKVVVGAWSSPDSIASREIVIPANGYAVAELALEALGNSTLERDEGDAFRPVSKTSIGAAVVRGTVLNANGSGIADARVSIVGSGSSARSAQSGEFTIIDAVSGVQTIEVRAIGFLPTRRPVTVADGINSPVVLRMDAMATALDTVRVDAATPPPAIRAIERRARSGVGTMLSGNDVVRRSSLFVSDALRGINGVFVKQAGGTGQVVWMRSFLGRECEATVLIDGVPLAGSDRARVTLDEFARPEDIAAIEVYPLVNLVPPEFMTMQDGCGVVLIWTKRATAGFIPAFSSRRKGQRSP